MARQRNDERVTEAGNVALKELASTQAQKRLLALRGKVEFSMSVEDMRYDR